MAHILIQLVESFVTFGSLDDVTLIVLEGLKEGA